MKYAQFTLAVLGGIAILGVVYAFLTENDCESERPLTLTNMIVLWVIAAILAGTAWITLIV